MSWDVCCYLIIITTTNFIFQCAVLFFFWLSGMGALIYSCHFCLVFPSFFPGSRVMHFRSAMFTSSVSQFSLFLPTSALLSLKVSCTLVFPPVSPLFLLWLFPCHRPCGYHLIFKTSLFSFTFLFYIPYIYVWHLLYNVFWLILESVMGLTCLFLIPFYCSSDTILFFLLSYLIITWPEIWCWFSFVGHFHVKFVVCSCRGWSGLASATLESFFFLRVQDFAVYLHFPFHLSLSPPQLGSFCSVNSVSEVSLQRAEPFSQRQVCFWRNLKCFHICSPSSPYLGPSHSRWLDWLQLS